MYTTISSWPGGFQGEVTVRAGTAAISHPVNLIFVPGVTEPADIAAEALDRHTLAWAAKLNQSGEAYVTPALLDGRWMVRVSIGAELTGRPAAVGYLGGDVDLPEPLRALLGPLLAHAGVMTARAPTGTRPSPRC